MLHQKFHSVSFTVKFLDGSDHWLHFMINEGHLFLGLANEEFRIIFFLVLELILPALANSEM